MSSSSSKEKKSRRRKRSSPAARATSFSPEIQKQLSDAWEGAANKKGTLQVRKAENLMKDFLGLDDVETSDFHQKETLDRDEFFSLAGRKLEQKSKAMTAFELMDDHKKGVVVLEDLQRVASDLGETFTSEELEEMIREVDQSSDGLLTPEDFVKIAKHVRL